MHTNLIDAIDDMVNIIEDEEFVCSELLEVTLEECENDMEFSILDFLHVITKNSKPFSDITEFPGIDSSDIDDVYNHIYNECCRRRIV